MYFLVMIMSKICTFFIVASPFLTGMNSTMKTNLGKLFSELLRYYYFDRCIGISKHMMSFDLFTCNEIVP